MTFNFTKHGSKAYKLNLSKAEDAAKAKDLLGRDYKMPDIPANKPAKKAGMKLSCE